MPAKSPPNSEDVRLVVDARIVALESIKGAQETVTVEWRGKQLSVPVISMPIALLHYNPDTHRIRAQRSVDPVLELTLENEPYGDAAQGYLHRLLMGDPSDPSKIDPSFSALKDDIRDHGQTEPGIITRAGVLINGNTRRAALKDLGRDNIRVGVLPTDAGHDDVQSIELSLQLRKDHKRDYSFMNFLLAVEERAKAGKQPTTIQSEFRIKPSTYDQSRWILDFVWDAIARSKVAGPNNIVLSLRLIDFETHQGKLEELYRAYVALARKSRDEADALREQRLLALLLDKSKTDLRLIEPDFVKRYMAEYLQPTTAAPNRTIPGTTISVSGPSAEVQALRALTTQVLQAKSIVAAGGAATPSDIASASGVLGKLNQSVDKALDHAGKQVRVVKRRFAAAERVSDACDDLALAIGAVAEARATSNFDPEDLDESLAALRSQLERLSAIVVRGSETLGEGTTWLSAIGRITGESAARSA